MEWTPAIFVTFKVLVLSTGMFFAIKWHYDQGKKVNGKTLRNERSVILSSAVKVALVFIVSLLCIGLSTFALIRTLGMDLTF